MTCILAEFEVDSREVVVYKLVACCVGGLDRLRVAGSSDGACVCFFLVGRDVCLKFYEIINVKE